MSGFASEPTDVTRVRDELAAGRPVALASILATAGSMPRHEGARMALLADGTLLGTVGGGNLEFMVIERLRGLIVAGAPELTWVRHEQNEMACGGDALLALRRLGAPDLPLWEHLSTLLTTGGIALLQEDWSDPAAPTVEISGASASGLGWSESARTFREVVSAPATCHVFGAGHVGTALVPMLAPLGFRVAIYDDRPEAADPERFPDAVVTCGSFSEIAAAAKICPADSVVVLTHGHVADIDVLAQVLRRDCSYVGCIGSRRKAGIVRDRLVAEGVDPDRATAVHLPIGEDILAVTPAEIAVSIAAQLVRCRALARPGRPHSISKSEVLLGSEK